MRAGWFFLSPLCGCGVVCVRACVCVAAAIACACALCVCGARGCVLWGVGVRREGGACARARACRLVRVSVFFLRYFLSPPLSYPFIYVRLPPFPSILMHFVWNMRPQLSSQRVRGGGGIASSVASGVTSGVPVLARARRVARLRSRGSGLGGLAGGVGAPPPPALVGGGGAGDSDDDGAGRPGGGAHALQENPRYSEAEVRGGPSPQSRLLNLHPHHRRRKTGRPPCGPSSRRCPGTGRACTASPSTGRGGEGGRRLGVEFWCAVCFFTLPAGLNWW